MLNEEFHKTCKKKHFITMVRFMTGVARPRYQSLKYRAKRTLIPKMFTVNAAVCKKNILENIIRAIKFKIPVSHTHRTIYV